MYKSFFVLIFPLITKAAFPDYTPYTYPDSITQSELCGQPKPSFICDPNNIVDRRTRDENSTAPTLDEELLFVRGKTECACQHAEMCSKSPRGYTISVAVVEKMILDSNETTRVMILEAAKVFADTVRDRQNRGQCDDDMVIFLSVRDEVLWTSMGETINISNSDVKRISEQGEQFFKKMKYREGLEWMIRQYTHVLRDEKIDKLWSWPLPEWAMLTIGVLILVILASLMCTTIYLCIRFCRRDKRDEYSVVDH